MYNYAAIASSAKEILNRDGWNKGYLTYPGYLGSTGAGSHCIGGALNLALSGGEGDSWRRSDGAAQKVYRELAQIIQNQFPERYAGIFAYSVDSHDDSHLSNIHTIARWNNHPDTTREEIDSVLNSLAEKELTFV